MNEELLISLVQKYPELYDNQDPHYHDDQRRMNIWEEIAETMNETPAKCKEKWQKIRENFRKAINLRKTKSGQGMKTFKPIRHAKEMSFLMPFIRNETVSLSNLLAGSSDEEQTNIASPPSTPGSSSSNSIVKKRKFQDTATNLQPPFQTNLEKSCNQQDGDPIIDFFTNMGHTVKDFPPDLRLRVKRQVFNIVSEAEEEVLSKDTQISLPIMSVKTEWSNPQF